MPKTSRVAPHKEFHYRCSCGEPQFLRIEAWDLDDPEPFVVGFMAPGKSLRALFRMWRHSRRCWSQDVTLTREQVVELRDGINSLLAV